MNYEAEIAEMKGNISSLQKDVTEIKVTQPLLQKTLEKNIETQEKLSETLHEVQLSLVSIVDQLNVQSHDISDIKKEMDENRTNIYSRISNVEEKIDTVDEEGKFNIRGFIKQYFPWIVVIIGVGANLIAKYVKF
jgi:chromosome segregation ATPase